MRFRLAALALAVTAFAGPAFAQPAQEERAAPVGGEAWYGEQLQELAEVLGGAHYLRILCEGRGDQRWRDYMRSIMAREPRHSDALSEGFNRGYRREEARFPDCDRSAQQWEAELRARGRRVADGLSARHAE